MDLNTLKLFLRQDEVVFDKEKSDFTTADKIKSVAHPILFSQKNIKEDEALKQAFLEKLEKDLKDNLKKGDWINQVEPLLDFLSKLEGDEARKTIEKIEHLVSDYIQSPAVYLSKKSPDFLKKNKEFVLKSIRLHPFSFQFADPSFKQSKEFMMEAVKQVPSIFCYADKALRDDTELFFKAFSKDKNVYSSASPSLQADPAYFIEALRDKNFLVHDVHFATLPKEILTNIDVANAVYDRDPYLIQQMDPTIFSNKELILTLSKKGDLIAELMDEAFRSDPSIMANLIKANSRHLESCDPSVFDDPKFFVEIAAKDVRLLSHMSERLKKDRDFVLFCVTLNGRALDYVDPMFYRDTRIMLNALVSYPEALKLVDVSLKYDLDFAHSLIEINPLFLSWVDPILQENEELVFRAIQRDGRALEFASKALQDMDEIVGPAVFNYPSAIQFASDRMKENMEIMIPLITRFPYLISYLKNTHPHYEILAEIACKENPVTLNQIDKDLAKNPDFLNKVLGKFGMQPEIAEQIALLKNQDLRGYLFEKFMQEGEASLLQKLPPYESTASITPIFIQMILESWNVSDEQLQAFQVFLTPGNIKALKDRDQKRIPILQALKALDESDMTSAEKIEFFFKMLKMENVKEVADACNILPLALKSQTKEQILSLDPLTLASLQHLVLNSLIKTGILAKEDADAFIAITKNSRMPEAFFVFAKDIATNPFVNIALQKIIKAICHNQFEELRHVSNSYRDLLSPDQIQEWEKSLSLKNERNLTVADSEDWQDLLMSGTEVAGSCQRIDGETQLKKCLVGTMLDGKIRILCIKHPLDQKILARSLLKIVQKQDGSPALLLELEYGKGFSADDESIKNLAIVKAKAMGLELYGSGLFTDNAVPLKSSRPNAAELEYEDSGFGEKVSDGQYRLILGKRLV